MCENGKEGVLCDKKAVDSSSYHLPKGCTKQAATKVCFGQTRWWLVSGVLHQFPLSSGAAYELHSSSLQSSVPKTKCRQ
jgi:hypothetical protein